MKKFTIVSVGRPFGPCEKLDNDDYRHEISNHETLSAAKKRLGREIAEMRWRSGQCGWDNHYAIRVNKKIKLIVRSVDWNYSENPMGNSTESIREKIYNSGDLIW